VAWWAWSYDARSRFTIIGRDEMLRWTKAEREGGKMRWPKPEAPKPKLGREREGGKMRWPKPEAPKPKLGREREGGKMR